MSLGWPLWALPPLVFSILGVIRLSWFRLFPYERKQLDRAIRALQDQNPKHAKEILETRLWIAGYHYKFLRDRLLSKTLRELGQFVEAHAVLAAVNEAALSPDEQRLLHCSWSQLFVDAGNLTEARRQLQNVEAAERLREPECLLVETQILQGLEQFREARVLLQSGLDRVREPCLRASLLNNLANIESLQGFAERHLLWLQAAQREFHKCPHSAATVQIHHNLAIALVRAGQIEGAKSVLDEAWNAGSGNNIQHVLSVLNTMLMAAREANNQDWKRDIYTKFDQSLRKFKNFTPAEQLALDVTEIRMRRNDGFPLPFATLLERSAKILKLLQEHQASICVTDRASAMQELRHQLELVAKQTYSEHDKGAALDVVRRIARASLKDRAELNKLLCDLSPKLILPVDQCYGFLSNMDKGEILLARTPQEALPVIGRLISRLKERAGWLEGEQAELPALEAQLTLCDEYVTYRDQLPPEPRDQLVRTYRPAAKHALHEALTALSSRSGGRFTSQFIGAAYYALKINQDQTTAKRLIDQVDNSGAALDHFALWLRDQYQYVKNATCDRTQGA
ncbi:hypothetical protein CCAE64S_01458 [Castellaniella caeni]